MKRFLSFLGLVGAGVLAATAVSVAAGSQRGGAYQSTTTNPAVEAAGAACKVQGLTPGSNAFKTCVQNMVKTTKTKTNTNPASTNPAVVAAGKTCKGKGLTPGSDAFKACIQAIVKGNNGGQTTTNSNVQAAQQACKAQGLTPGSHSFKQCVKQQLGK